MQCIGRFVTTTRSAAFVRYGRSVFACVFSCALLMPGCTATQSTARPEVAGDVVVDAQSDLREKIDSFVEFFQTTIEAAAADIERQASTKEYRTAAAMWRVRLIEECRATVNQDDAREVLVDLWTLCERMHAFLTQGEGKAVFGASQPVAVACSEKIDEALEKLVVQFVPPGSLATMREKISAYSSAHPIHGEFAVAPAERLSDTPEIENRLGELVTLPLAPFKALAAIGKTPESVRDVSKSVYRFSDVLEDLPASARWQLRLLGADLDESTTVTGAVGSFKQLSDSSAQVAADATRFVQVVDKMPQTVREQAEVLLKSVDQSQPEIQTTLKEAQKTASTVREASGDIRETVGSVDRTVVDVRESAVALERAANAVTVTAKEISKFIPSDMKDGTGQIIGSDPNEQRAVLVPNVAAAAGADAAVVHPVGMTATPSPSFSFQAVTESADSLGATTEKLRGLLGDLRTFVDNGTLSTGTLAIDQQMRGTVDFSAVRLEGVVDHAAKRLAQLFVLAFVLAIIYRFTTNRQTQSRQAESDPACLAAD